jgi:hypothetical protein
MSLRGHPQMAEAISRHTQTVRLCLLANFVEIREIASLRSQRHNLIA